MEILSNWFELISQKTGYLAREQSRGEEITSMIPKQFQTQHFKEGNPPTLLFPLIYLLKNNNKSEKIIDFIGKNFGKLQKWFDWFIEIQWVNNKNLKEINYENADFKWYCNPSLCKDGFYLGSGLDDYPRHSENTVSQSHLDLHCWIMFFSKSLKEIAGFLAKKKWGIKQTASFIVFEKNYGNIYKKMNINLWKNFYNDANHLFCDKNKNKINGKKEFTNFIGYVNLFPFMFGFVNEKSKAFEV